MNIIRCMSFFAVLFFACGQAVADSKVFLVQTSTIALKGVIGKLDHLAVDAKGERLFVANKPNNTLDIVDLKSGKLVKQIGDQIKVSGVSYAADLDMIYVGNGGGVCNAFDGKSYQQVFSAKAPDADNVHYLAENNSIYCGAGMILWQFDAKTGDVKAQIPTPGKIHGFRIDKDAGKIYNVLTTENVIGVVDIAKGRVTDKFPLTLADGGSPSAQDRERGLLYVGCPNKKPMVVVFDLKTGTEIASVAIPGGADDLQFDVKRNRVYASCAESALVVIEKVGGTYQVVAKFETPKFSRTCTWANDKLYLGVPKQEGKEGPEVYVYEARPFAVAANSNSGK